MSSRSDHSERGAPVRAVMIPAELMDDELDYELNIRGVTTVLADRVRKLELWEEHKDDPLNNVRFNEDISPSKERVVLKAKLGELRSIIALANADWESGAIQEGKCPHFARLSTLYVHCVFRVRRCLFKDPTRHDEFRSMSLSLAKMYETLDDWYPDTDNWYNESIKKVTDDPDSYEKFKIQDGKLIKLITVQSNLPLKWIQVLPAEAREEALKLAHDEPTSGHGAWRRTFHRLRSHAYWPNMTTDVKKYCASCSICQQSKTDRRKPPGLMGSGDVVSQPMELISADLIGPLLRSSKGYTFISVVTDSFSKNVFIRPLRKATANAVTNHLKEEVILKHGAPRLLLVDNGQQYRSHQFQNL
ncbi:hypothetical protein FOCC_FOCC016252 [Frankliniella occidentalis]|nr:hypothetical protein FOCC_FOCC016252 [Frankliniella occidentalis]